MAGDLNQGKIIKVLNAYLESNNLPHQMDTEGICNGLSSVYAKYLFEGRQQEFKDLLKYISGELQPTADIEDSINHFVIEILLSFTPEKFNRELNQARGIELLHVQGKPLKSRFNIAMVAEDKDWVSIFNDIALEEHEVFLIGSVNHEIAVSRRSDGKYEVYDPNYPSGSKTFDDNDALVEELHHRVFYYQKGASMGLEISLIPHPNAEQRPYPSVQELYNKYLNDININIQATCGEISASTLTLAVRGGADKSAINLLLNYNAIEVLKASIEAVKNNNASALEALLPKVKSQSEQLTLIFTSLSTGRLDAFHKLLQDNDIKTLYEKYLNKLPLPLLQQASIGGHPELLKQLCDDIIQQNGQEQFKKIIFQRDEERGKDDAITETIKHGHTDCFKLLIDKCNTLGCPLTEEQKLAYLVTAIEANHPAAAGHFITELPLGALQSINLSTSAIEKTDLSILQALQHKGVNFSTIDAAVIQQKEKQPVSGFTYCGIMLCKFYDWLTCKADVALDTQKFSDYKAQMKAITADDPAKAANASAEEPSEVNMSLSQFLQ